MGPIDPADLPLNPETIIGLYALQDRFDGHLNWADPGGSTIRPVEVLGFEHAARQLWRAVRAELATTHTIFLRSTLWNIPIRHFRTPEELYAYEHAGRPQVLHLMGDYQLWTGIDESPPAIRAIDGAEVGLAPSTVAALREVSDHFAVRFDWNDSRAMPDAEFDALTARAYPIWHQIRRELAATHTVLFGGELAPEDQVYWRTHFPPDV